MRDFPAAVRPAVLASPLPVQANAVASGIVGSDPALDPRSAACGAEPVSVARRTDLHESPASAVAKLSASPLGIRGTHRITGDEAELAVDGSKILESVCVAELVGPQLRFMPASSDGVVGGNNVVFETPTPGIPILATGARLGANQVVNGDEEYGLTSAAAVVAVGAASVVRLDPAVDAFARSSGTFKIWAEFAVTPVGPGEVLTVSGDVPVVGIAGGFDPIAPR